MANPGKMVTGFNHNIKHKGRVFHVQTEDSGVDNPHIITHLFLGGNILASKKTSYADIAHAENLTELVRALMEEQHKEMLRNLIHGSYDEVVAQYTARAWQPGVVDTPEGAAPPAAAAPATPAAAAPAASAPPPVAAPPAPSKPLPPEVVAAQNLAVKPKPREGGETIFGEDLISERSLDEVILSYLADDGTET
jgi:hypothetical protein